MIVERLVIDTNLLVLYVVGTTDRGLINRHKRLSAFVPEDYDALLRIIEKASAILVTPHTLAETSNLASNIAEPARSAVLNVLRAVVGRSEELHVAAREACERGEYIRLGLPDAVQLQVLGAKRTLLTTDLDLHLAALSAGQDTINFNEIRDTYLGTASTDA